MPHGQWNWLCVFDDTHQRHPLFYWESSLGQRNRKILWPLKHLFMIQNFLVWQLLLFICFWGRTPLSNPGWPRTGDPQTSSSWERALGSMPTQCCFGFLSSCSQLQRDLQWLKTVKYCPISHLPVQYTGRQIPWVGRWLSCQEHRLLLPRTQVQLLAPVSAGSPPP